MTKKTRNRFTQQQKNRAIDDYLSGEKTAREIADDLKTDVQSIYRWKVDRDEKAKGIRLEELVAEGASEAQAKRIYQLERENDEYKKKLAEQILINDLLKKLQISNTSPPESELSGLIDTIDKSDRKRKRAKR